MKTLQAELIMFGVLLSSISITAAAAVQIVDCPVRDVEAQLKTPLPKDWWYTPTVKGLESVRIQNVGGQATLMCLYGAFGGQVAVMREQPPKTRGCKADTRALRFICYPY